MIRIALIDDQPIVLEGIRLLLGRINDFEVVAEYPNGRELVDNINEIDADIILTDIDMPVMDGITATRLITSDFPEKKVIALSMHCEPEYYYDMITSGAKGFVLKQSSIKELEQAIRDVYKGANYFSPQLLHNVIINMKKTESNTLKNRKIQELSQKEIQLLSFICQGLSNKELAEKLFLSVKTVENHKAKLMDKTETKNNAGLIIWAIKNKIVDF
jgi:DNA-binding NarL/FixJ family response regulator